MLFLSFSHGERKGKASLSPWREVLLLALPGDRVPCLCSGRMQDSPVRGAREVGRNKPAQDMCDDLPQTGRKSRWRLVRPV